MPVGAGISFTQLVYQPIYDRLSVDALLILADTRQFLTRALDKTEGVALSVPGGVMLETVTPIAEMMMADLLGLKDQFGNLAGVTENDVDGATITLFPIGVDTSVQANGVTWNIISHRMNPSPSGRADGTIFLQLEGDPDG